MIQGNSTVMPRLCQFLYPAVVRMTSPAHAARPLHHTSLYSNTLYMQVGNEATTYPDDHPRARVVKEVVASLSDQVHKLEHLPAHLRNVDWRVTVVESKSVNAMAAPGGRIIVFTGTPFPLP